MPIADLRHFRRRGFTLIELMVAVGIIVVLLGILTIAVVAANKHAKRTLQAADFQTISLALNNYKSDFGDYPRIVFTTPGTDPNGTYTNYGANNNSVYGSQLLCWALISPGSVSDDGADGPGFRTRRDPNSSLAFPNNYVGRTYGPYLDPEKFTIAANSKYGATPSSADGYEILDRWGNPILYYPAKAGTLSLSGANAFVADSGGGTSSSPLFDYGINYNGYMTLAQMQKTLNADTTTGALDAGVTPATTGPFILWSAGPSGVFGDGDDITTFNQ